MSSIGILGVDQLVRPSFPTNPAGLWEAIVGKIAVTDPAGSGLVGSSWPDQPPSSERGMFDFVVPSPTR